MWTIEIEELRSLLSLCCDALVLCAQGRTSDVVVSDYKVHVSEDVSSPIAWRCIHWTQKVQLNAMQVDTSWL